LHQGQDLCERHLLLIVVDTQFGVAKVAANVNVRYAGARLDQLLELLRSAEFVGLARNNKAQLELAGNAAGFCSPRPGRPLGFRRMMVVIVIMAMVMMIVAMVMLMVMIVIMVVLTTGTMNMFFVFRFRHENL
jgi:hypothetical protein